MTWLSDAQINALLVEPGHPPREVWMENNKNGVLDHIDGDAISKMDVPNDAACFLFSAAPSGDEHPNRAIDREEGGGTVIISGPFLVAGRLFKNKLCSLSFEQMETYRRLFHVPHVFVRDNNTIEPGRENG